MKIDNLLKEKSIKEIKELIQSEPYNINIKETDKYILFKYSQIKSDFSKELVRDCRGIIIDKNTKEIVCRPFRKFFNYQEEFADKIDWNSAKIMEKIDGSLIKIWFDEKWHISTNSTIDAAEAKINYLNLDFKWLVENTIMENYNLDLDEFTNMLDKNYTHLFEVVSKYNKIVIEYKESKIYYLTSIYTKTGEEKEFDYGFYRPKKYSFNSLQELINKSNEIGFEFEGYVVSDKYNNRIKIKSPEYFRIHKLVNNGNITFKYLYEIIKINETPELLSYYPELKERIDNITSSINEVKYRIYKDWILIYNPNDTKKEFALKAINTFYPHAMFTLYKLKDQVNKEIISEYINSFNADKIKALIRKLEKGNDKGI